MAAANDNSLRYLEGRDVASRALLCMSRADFPRAMQVAHDSADPFDAGWMRRIWEAGR